jgi:Ca2+-binding EF-hand superfamily protein
VERLKFFTPLLLAETFDFIDANSNGFLQKDELKYFLKTLPRDEIDQLYKEMLPNHEGKIDKQAFISYIQKQLK